MHSSFVLIFSFAMFNFALVSSAHRTAHRPIWLDILAGQQRDTFAVTPHHLLLKSPTLRLCRVLPQNARELLGNNLIFAGLQHERVHRQSRFLFTR
jgi:hypothetical protein